MDKSKTPQRFSATLMMVVICMMVVLSTGLTSAMEIDNWVSYDNNDMKVVIENAFGLPFFGSEIGTLELKSHKSVDEIIKIAPGKDRVTMYYDFDFNEIYENGLGDVDFINMTDGEEIKKDYHFVIWDTIIEEKNSYSIVCNEVYNPNNNSYYQVCEQVIKGTYETQREGWVELNTKDIPKGKVRIGLATDVNLNETIDGIWTVAGKKIKKHAVWTADLNIGLMSYYKSNDNLATTNVIDSIDNNNGTLGGGDNTDDLSVSGIIDTALHFNGADDVIDLNDGNDFDFVTGDDFSVSFWIKPDVWTNGLRIFSNDDGVNGYQIIEATSGGSGTGDNIQFWGNGGNLVVSTDEIVIGEWNHIVITFDSGTAKIYINASTPFTGSTTISASTEDLFIGVDPSGPDNYYDGVIDEIGIWNRTLSQSEITQLYNNGIGITWTEVFEFIDITLNSPEDNFVTQNQTIVFNTSINVTDLEVVSVKLLIDGVVNETNTSGVIGDYIFQKDLDFGNYNWSIEVVDNETDTTSSPTIDLFISDGSSSAFWTNEYQVRIIALNLTESDFEINNVVVTQEDDNLWKINTTEGDYEVARAQVMKTFFYGTDGTDPRINRTSGLLKIQTIDSRDPNKKGYFIKTSTTIPAGDSELQFSNLAITFNDVTNNTDFSSWSNFEITYIGGIYNSPAVTSSWQVPTATILHSITSNTESSDEIGTDTSSDELDNPATATLRSESGRDGQSDRADGTSTAIFLYDGTITISPTSTGTPTTIEIDFNIDKSIPAMSPIPNITLNSPVDNITELIGTSIIFNATSTIDGGILNEMKLFINGVLNESKSLSGTEDTETFNKTFTTLGNNNWSIEVCDTNDNCASSETRDFTISEIRINSINFSEETTSGAQENFTINITFDDSFSGVSMLLNYNGTNHSMSTTDIGLTREYTTHLVIPSVSEETNITLFFIAQLSNDTGITTINTDTDNQTVQPFLIDDCSVFTDVLLSFTMIDEDSLQEINGTIEFAVDVFSVGTTDLVNSFNSSYDYIIGELSEVCLDNITEEYSMSYQLRYFGDESQYFKKYRNIQLRTINNDTIPENITLSNLNLSRGHSFNVIVVGNLLSSVGNAGLLVDTQRQYLATAEFVSVESPVTDSSGVAISNLVETEEVYNFLVSFNGELLGTFNNYQVKCANAALGQCSITLNLASATGNPIDFETVGNITQIILLDQDTNTLHHTFSSTDGTSKTVRSLVIKNDGYANETICDGSSSGTSGTILCAIPLQYQNVSIIVQTFESEILLGSNSFSQGVSPDWQGADILIMLLMFSSLVLLMVAHPITIIIGAMLGLTMPVLLISVAGASFGVLVGATLFYIAGGIVAIIVIGKKRP